MRVFHGIHSSFPWTCLVEKLGTGLDLDVVRDPLKVPSSSQDLVNFGVGMPICEPSPVTSQFEFRWRN